MLRKALFAGSFYDSSPNRLKAEIESWLNSAKLPEINEPVLGVICPHAGYMYSGSCAAYSYKLLSHKCIETAIIIHPSHRGNHFGFSVSPYKTYETPLGILKLNEETAENLFEQGAEVIDNWYHQNEHSMEVQLPFLAYLNPDINVVPIMVGNQNNTVSNNLADILLPMLNEETVIIVSTDLSHYHSAMDAESMDKKLIDNITSIDGEGFYNNIKHGWTEACGFSGVLTLINLAKLIPDAKLIELHYTHSGIASGDFEQVVGYLSAAFVKGK